MHLFLFLSIYLVILTVYSSQEQFFLLGKILINLTYLKNYKYLLQKPHQILLIKQGSIIINNY
jgi:hypothetical protein